MLVYDFPHFVKISKVRMRIVANTRGYESAFSRHSAYERMAGERWVAEMEMAPMIDRGQARELRAFLSKLDGRSGTVAVSDPAMHVPSGAIGSGSNYNFSDGTGFSDGTNFDDASLAASVYAVANRGDDSIVLSGFPVSLAAAIRPGDQFQVGSVYDGVCQLFEAQGQVSTDSNGRCRVTVRPRVRETILAGAQVTFYRPKARFRLAADDTVVEIDPQAASLAVNLIEVI